MLMETAVEEGLTGYLNERMGHMVHNLISNSIKCLFPALRGESGYQEEAGTRL